MTTFADFELKPAIRLNEGRMIRTVGDAIKLLHEHEAITPHPPPDPVRE